jgi:uncharacterized protein (DUF4415 family)
MKKEKNIKSYSAAELRAEQARSLTNLGRVKAITDKELERLIKEDPDEEGFRPDWTRAEIVLPKAKKSVHLRLEQEIIDYFRTTGRGHISRMQAVLKAYVDAHDLGRRN